MTHFTQQQQRRLSDSVVPKVHYPIVSSTIDSSTFIVITVDFHSTILPHCFPQIQTHRPFLD